MVQDKIEKVNKTDCLLLKKLLYYYSIVKTAIYERNIRTSYILKHNQFFL